MSSRRRISITVVVALAFVLLVSPIVLAIPAAGAVTSGGHAAPSVAPASAPTAASASDPTTASAPDPARIDASGSNVNFHQETNTNGSFKEETVFRGLNQPMEVAFLPDGRALIIQKNGKVLIGDPSTGNYQTYMQIQNVDTYGERGLEGIALDPNFEQNGHFYLYYIRESDPHRARVSRFKHVSNSGGLSSRGNLSSETVVWQDNSQVKGTYHYGGGLEFGPDGAIYLTTGEEFDPSQAQDLTESGGKIHRFYSNGTIPADNPFVDDPDALDSIWAYGLRNPFRASWDHQTGRFFIGEVGGNNDSTAMEDIHLGKKGANYGWPACEGMCENESYSDPIYTYPHDGQQASVTAGTVYRGSNFPNQYREVFFYGDYARDWISYLTFDDQGNVVDSHRFDSSTDGVVNIEQGPEGALYWSSVTQGTINRFVYQSENEAPVITEASANTTGGRAPLTVEFTANASDPEGESLEYTWYFGNNQTATGQTVTHTYTNNGTYDAYVEVTDGNRTTVSDPITVSIGSIPNVTVSAPENGSLFRAGDTINFSGSATDPEDGQLSDSQLSWTVEFAHNNHTHPVISAKQGSSGSFDISTSGHNYQSYTRYQITLTATDSDGLQDRETVTVWPDKREMTLKTQPSGLEVKRNGITYRGSTSFGTLIGFEHEVSAPSTQCVDGTQYEFQSWSDGGARTHTVTMPASNITLTANYEASGPCSASLPQEGLVLQLEGGQGVSTSNGQVTGWADQSGMGNDLTANGNPTLTTAPSGAQAISFDGDGDELVRTSSLNGFSTGSEARTVFLVGKYESTGFGGVTYGSPSWNNAFGTVVSSSGELTVQGWGGSNDFVSSTQGTGAGWLTQSVTYDGSQFVHYYNGTQIGSGTHSFSTTNDKLAVGSELGAPPYLDMQVGAVVVYNQSLSDTERQEVQQYLQDKYVTGSADGSTNTAPTANDDSASVELGNSTTVDVLANDTDSDGSLNTSSVTIQSTPSAGTVTVNADGTITYTHDGSSTTSDSFTYTVEDDAGAVSNEATVSINVTSGGDGDDTTTNGSLPVTNGLVLSLNASEGVSTSSGQVTGWADQSGMSNDLTANGNPTLTTAPSGAQAISFDGDGDELVRTSSLNGFSTGSEARTVFLVGEYESTGFGGVTYGSAAWNDAFGTVVNDAGELTVQGWGGSNDYPSGVNGTGAGWLTQSVTYDGSQFVHYRNGTQIDSGTHTFSTTSDKLVVGAEIDSSPYLDMNVGAVVVYNRSLSDTERQEVQQYLQEQYLSGSSDGGTTNAAPTANDDSATVESGNSTTVDVLANDTDSDGTLNTSSVTVETAPSAGSVTVNADGTVTYTHDGSSTTNDSFTYTVEDDAGAVSNEATVSVNVTSGGDGGGDSTTTSDVPVTDGLVLSLNASEGVSTSSGQVTEWADQSGMGNDLTANGNPTLTTAPSGAQAISFDGDGDELVRTSSLNGFSTGSEARTMFVVGEYESTGFGGVTYGSAAWNDAFGTVVNDAGELTVQGWGGSNDYPSGVNGTGAGWLTQSVTYDGSQFVHYRNGSQIDSGTHTFSTTGEKFVVGSEIDSSPYLDMNVGAVVVYNRSLSDTERQEVQQYLQEQYLSGSPDGGTTNAAPTANDDSATVESGNSTTIDVLANDTDSDGTLNTSSVTIQSTPSSGSATVNADGTVTYTHDGSSTTSDSFTYTVEDDAGAVSNTATVSVNVTSSETTNTAPTANDDSTTVESGNSTTVDVLANDTDSDGTLNASSVTIQAPPSAGSVTVNADGTITYTHDGSSTTSDSFTYTVADDDGAVSNEATVSVNVTSGSDGGGDSTTTSDVPVTDGLVLSLNASEGVSTSSGQVTGWADQSGMGNDLTANGNPTLTTAPSGAQAISFDGDGDELVRTSSLNGFSTGSEARTMFVVGEYESTGFGGVTYGSAAWNDAFGTVVNDAGELTVQGWGGSNDYPSGVNGTGAGWLTQSVTYDGSQFVHYRNGSQIDSGTHTFSTTGEKFVVGAEIDSSPYLDMNVGAVVVYNRSLSDTERQEVQQYLQERYLNGTAS